MADEAAAPAVAEPMQTDEPVAAPAEEQSAADEAGGPESASEPATSSEKPKPQPKAKATPKKTQATNAAATTPASGARQRKKVEHFKPEEAKESSKLTVQEVRGRRVRHCAHMRACLRHLHSPIKMLIKRLSVILQGAGTKLRDIPNGESHRTQHIEQTRAAVAGCATLQTCLKRDVSHKTKS